MPDTNLLLLLVGVVIGGAVGFFALGSRAFRPRGAEQGSASKPVSAHR
ncbi:hypothetical protein MKK70_05925 [Methylobacterium sp. E-041]|jgi:hypothetical protein|nr:MULTISPECIES: hypothetical protein [unclassified Methylobacterium]MCJ2010867.1 hypothetical protein [Methylobacterium sp. J-092]MCJ2042674.1 hypothetical protein [Methylobacterium sp. J-059]MCJ2078148.1 hypothetical protein [Methylobacterium sp. E-016]MCJ2104925.1 hypothetical protein [Methylobacterium sp. E-041]MCJ2113857.1 hypothetical protein [Methylobacterium sp. E-025]